MVASSFVLHFRGQLRLWLDAFCSTADMSSGTRSELSVQVVVEVLKEAGDGGDGKVSVH